jgi:hypothetical protein
MEKGKGGSLSNRVKLEKVQERLSEQRISDAMILQPNSPGRTESLQVLAQSLILAYNGVRHDILLDKSVLFSYSFVP